MRPFTLGVTTLVQGLYAFVWLVILFDVASPTFMHTISRAIFHSVKQQWSLTILSSPTVRRRFGELGSAGIFPGGESYDEIFDEKTPDKVRNASAYLHLLEYQIMTRAPEVFASLQVYRDQYRLARAFIIPSLALALVLPFWGPVATLDGAGMIEPFPIIRTQLFLLGVLAAVSFVAFRERSHRYAAAKVLAFTTMEGTRMRDLS
jgi:hypothetical protein